MTDETVVDVLEVAEKVLVEVNERVKVSTGDAQQRAGVGRVWLHHSCVGERDDVPGKHQQSLRAL